MGTGKEKRMKSPYDVVDPETGEVLIEAGEDVSVTELYDAVTVAFRCDECQGQDCEACEERPV